MDHSIVSKKFLFAVTSICVILVTVYILFFQLDKRTKIIFCQTGKSFVAYLRIYNQVDVLINSGSGSGVLSCLSRHMPFFDKGLEALFLTSLEPYAIKSLSYLNDRYVIKHIYLLFKKTKQSEFLLIPYKNKSKIVYLTAYTKITTDKNITFNVGLCQKVKKLTFRQKSVAYVFFDTLDTDKEPQTCIDNKSTNVIFSPNNSPVTLTNKNIPLVLFSPIKLSNQSTINMQDIKERVIYVQ